MYNIQTFLRRYQQRYEDKGRFLQFSAACAEERKQQWAHLVALFEE